MIKGQDYDLKCLCSSVQNTKLMLSPLRVIPSLSKRNYLLSLTPKQQFLTHLLSIFHIVICSINKSIHSLGDKTLPLYSAVLPE